MAQSPRSVASPLKDINNNSNSKSSSELGDVLQRHSSTSSSDTAEHGSAAVTPLATDSNSSNTTVDATQHATPQLDLDKLQQHDPNSSANAASAATTTASATTTTPTTAPSPLSSAVYNTFSFGDVLSPRHVHANGKRYLSGYLLHRVSIAGGFLKTWKRKFFRLRDHGLVCYRASDNTAPVFTLHFTAHSALTGGASTDLSINADTKSSATTGTSIKKANTNALVLILTHVDIVTHQTGAGKIDVPLTLRAETQSDYRNWLESLRIKIDARRRALVLASVDAIADDDTFDTSISTGTNAAESTGCTPEISTASQSSVASTLSAATNMTTSSPTSSSSLTDLPAYATFQDTYVLMNEIGEGSFSIVHRAVSRVTGSLVAVKCCKRTPALDDEVRILKQLAHPNIVGINGVYYDDTDDTNCFVAMDLMDDGDLCDRLIAQQRLSESEAHKIVAQVLQGLAYLHANCIVHRDIKPENILLHGNAVKLADFGLAKQLATPNTKLSRSCGTLEYAAPELLTGAPYGLKSDVFSLGVVLYVLLFGAFPFSIESAAMLQQLETFPDGQDVRDMRCLDRQNVQWQRVSADAQDAILRMLEPLEADRVSAKELLLHPWFDPDATQPMPVGRFGTKSISGTDINGAPRRERRDSKTWEQLELRAARYECERLADCATRGFRELLCRGLEMTKFGYKGATAPHSTTLSIDFVHNVVVWTARAGALALVTGRSGSITDAKPGGRVIRLSDVQEVRVGHATDAFASAKSSSTKDALPPPERCLSIVCSWRTLDLVVRVASQREFLVKGLTALLESIGGNSSGSGSSINRPVAASGSSSRYASTSTARVKV